MNHRYYDHNGNVVAAPDRHAYVAGDGRISIHRRRPPHVADDNAAEHGWYPYEADDRPADTVTHTHRSHLTVDGGVVRRTWTPVEKPPEQVAQERRDNNAETVTDRMASHIARLRGPTDDDGQLLRDDGGIPVHISQMRSALDVLDARLDAIRARRQELNDEINTVRDQLRAADPADRAPLRERRDQLLAEADEAVADLHVNVGMQQSIRYTLRMRGMLIDVMRTLGDPSLLDEIDAEDTD